MNNIIKYAKMIHPNSIIIILSKKKILYLKNDKKLLNNLIYNFNKYKCIEYIIKQLEKLSISYIVLDRDIGYKTVYKNILIDNKYNYYVKKINKIEKIMSQINNICEELYFKTNQINIVERIIKNSERVF